MTQENLKTRLQRELHEYLADLREIREDLRLKEGWLALALLFAAALMTAAWVIVSLGFNPSNEHVSTLLYKLGLRSCRPISNTGGVIVIINLFLLLFLTAVTIGNVVNLVNRVKQGLPREPRDLIITTSLMLVSGIGGIIYMLAIC